MRAIDTNVLVRLLIRDEPGQTVAAENFVQNGAWISVLALVEATWVLASVYELTPRQIADSVEMLSDHQSLVLENPETILAALHLFRKRPKLGFSDCVMLHLAKKAGHLPLGTFDRDLARVDDVQFLS
jgi:predicted nucleic-acid-binding protein